MTPPLLQAYGSSRIAAGQVQQILHWPGSFETFRKIPTCLLYSDDGQVLAWGLEAKNASPMPGTVKCEWSVLVVYPVILSAYPYGILRHILTIVAHFGSDVWLTAFPFTPAVARFKLFLEPHALRDAGAVDPRLPSLPVRVTHLNGPTIP